MKKDKKYSVVRNGVDKKIIEKEVEATETTEIDLSETEVQVLKDLEKSLLDAKIKLADLEMHLKTLSLNKDELITFITNCNASFMSNVRTIAVNHGIDPDGTKEKWNFNTTTMTFNKVK